MAVDHVLIGICATGGALVWRYNARGLWSRLFSWWLFAFGLSICIARLLRRSIGYD